MSSTQSRYSLSVNEPGEAAENDDEADEEEEAFLEVGDFSSGNSFACFFQMFVSAYVHTTEMVRAIQSDLSSGHTTHPAHRENEKFKCF